MTTKLLALILLILLGPFAVQAQNVQISNSPAKPGQVTDIAYSAAAVTPSNSVDLTNPATRGLWVGGAGDVKIDLITGGTVTITAVAAGTWLKMAAKRVYATGTSATLIIELY